MWVDNGVIDRAVVHASEVQEGPVMNSDPLFNPRQITTYEIGWASRLGAYPLRWDPQGPPGSRSPHRTPDPAA